MSRAQMEENVWLFLIIQTQRLGATGLALVKWQVTPQELAPDAHQAN